MQFRSYLGPSVSRAERAKIKWTRLFGIPAIDDGQKEANWVKLVFNYSNINANPLRWRKSVLRTWVFSTQTHLKRFEKLCLGLQGLSTVMPPSLVVERAPLSDHLRIEHMQLYYLCAASFTARTVRPLLVNIVSQILERIILHQDNRESY